VFAYREFSYLEVDKKREMQHHYAATLTARRPPRGIDFSVVQSIIFPGLTYICVRAYAVR